MKDSVKKAKIFKGDSFVSFIRHCFFNLRLANFTTEVLFTDTKDSKDYKIVKVILLGRSQLKDEEESFKVP